MLFTDAAVPLLLGALCDPDAVVRFTAVDGLDDIEQFTDRDVFERMLDDPDADIRSHARYILENHYP